MSHRLVSVIIPAYNAERFVADAIDSVLVQTYPNIELIVVDDGSTDGTARIVQSYGDRLRYFHQPNQRQAVARNHGLQHATGELVAFLDSDDIWHPEKIAKQVALWQTDQTLGMVYCLCQEFDQLGRLLSVRPANLRGNCLRMIILGEGEGVFAGSTALVPRHVFDTVGVFDPELPPCEDSDFVWRVASRYPIDFVAESLVLYRLHSQNSHKNFERAATGWEGISRKVFRNERVLSLEWHTRFRIHSRYEYMISGLYFHAGVRWRALYHGVRSILWWPPRLMRLASRSLFHSCSNTAARLSAIVNSDSA